MAISNLQSSLSYFVNVSCAITCAAPGWLERFLDEWMDGMMLDISVSPFFNPTLLCCLTCATQLSIQMLPLHRMSDTWSRPIKVLRYAYHYQIIFGPQCVHIAIIPDIPGLKADQDPTFHAVRMAAFTVVQVNPTNRTTTLNLVSTKPNISSINIP